MKAKKEKVRKPANRKDGKVVRVSAEVYARLAPRLSNTRKKSMDSVLRRLLGLKERVKDAPPAARVFWLLPQEGKSFRNKAEARGEAIMSAVGRGEKRAEAPVKVREV